MSKDSKNFRKEFNSYMKEIKPSDKLINDTLILLQLEQQKIDQEKSKKNRIFAILGNSTFRRYSALACTVLLSLFAVKLYNSTIMEDIPVAPIETTVTPEVTTVTSYSDNSSNSTKFSTGTSYLTSYDEYIIETETSTAEFYTNTLIVTSSSNQTDVITTTQDISENTLYNGGIFNTQTSSVTSMGGLSTPIAMGTTNLHNDDDNYIDNVQSNEIVTTINSEVPNIDTKFTIVDTKPTTTSTHTVTTPTHITTTTAIMTTPTHTTMTTPTVTTPTMTTPTHTTVTTPTVTTPTHITTTTAIMTTTTHTTVTTPTVTTPTHTTVTTTTMTTTTSISMTIPTYTNITTTSEVEIPCTTTALPDCNDSTSGDNIVDTDESASSPNNGYFGDSENSSSDNTVIENFNMEDINKDNLTNLFYPYTAVRVILKNSSDGYYYNGIVDNDKILKEFPNGSFINSNSIIPIYKGDEYCDLLLIYNDYAKIVSMNTMNFINTNSARISNDYELVTPLLCESFNYSDYNGNNIMGDIEDIQIAFDNYLQIDDLPLTDTRIMNILKNVDYLKALFDIN